MTQLDWLHVGLWIFSITGWLLYFREVEVRRDVLTDLMQLIHDYDVGREELRRSLGYRPVEQRFDTKEDDSQ